MKLYSFHRSSASYRVRIALALKGLPYTYVPVRLDADPARSEHLGDAYGEVNPQRLVPFLVDGDVRIGQSLAILEHLDRRHPDPALFPADAAGRARVLSIALYVASEIHPLCALRVQRRLRDSGFDAAGVAAWCAHWMHVGFTALERLLDDPATGRFAHGDAPTAADCYLVPQVVNARRAGLDLGSYPILAAVVAAAEALPAFRDTAAEHMPDFEAT